MQVEAEEVAPPRPIILGTTGRGVRLATNSALISDVRSNPQHINAANAGVVPVFALFYTSGHSKAAGQVITSGFAFVPTTCPQNPQHAGLLSRQSMRIPGPHRRHKSPDRAERVAPTRLFYGYFVWNMTLNKNLKGVDVSTSEANLSTSCASANPFCCAPTS